VNCKQYLLCCIPQLAYPHEEIVTWWSYYRHVLNWWSYMLDCLLQRVSTLCNSLLHKHTSVHSHKFTSRCSVAASNCGRFPSSGFSNLPRRQLRLISTISVTHHPIPLNWLTRTVLHITSRHGQHRKHLPSVAFYGPLHSNCRCLVVCFAIVV
jgi:hypothetical protein